MSDNSNYGIRYHFEVYWTCQFCQHIVVRFGTKNSKFVCWECYAVLTAEEGLNKIG